MTAPALKGKGQCPYCGKFVKQATAREHWLRCPKKPKR